MPAPFLTKDLIPKFYDLDKNRAVGDIFESFDRSRLEPNSSGMYLDWTGGFESILEN
jgi:hypothetical protein